MEQPTPSQWKRFTAMRLQLEPMADDERREALHAVQSENPDDARVVALLAVHFAMPESPTQGIGSGDRIDDFILGERLGAGGMGVVYEATQSLGDASRSVAIKLINPLLWGMAPNQSRERFADEIKAQAALQYNGLARLYTAGTYEDPATHTDVPYLVMELVHGARPITDFVREQSLDTDERLQLFQRICRALQHAHDHRIIHRDLKPDNILIDSEGRPFVVDFGLAQTVDAVLPGANMVTSGTVAYMSPEQLSTEFGPISGKTDSYALGVILYELLTGSKPYETSLDDSLEQLTKVIATEPPKDPEATLNEELQDIVLKALSKNPKDRPTAGELGMQLSHYLTRYSLNLSLSSDSSAIGGTLWSELRCRGVFRVAGVYTVAALIALQVAKITFEPLNFPPWAIRSLIVTAAAGFPMAVFLAWTFEKTPAGMIRDKRFGGAHRISGLLVGVVAVVLGIFGYALFTHDTTTESLTLASTSNPVAERPRGIAVLPFDNLSADPANAFFAGGMHEEVLSRIARIPDIRVISRTSMVSVAKLGLEVGAIAERLNVSHVLEGSVRRDGERVRITVQLIDPQIDGHLWTETYDRTLGDVFAIQSQIALAIAAQLEAELGPETTALIVEVPTTNKEAHDLYLQALAERDIWRNADTFLAMKPLLEKAVALDPEFLQAQALLVEVYGRLLWTGADPERIYGPKALELVTDIRRRWPERPESLVALADYHYTVERDYEGAKALYLKALPELPNDTHLIGNLAASYKRLQQFEESLGYARKRIELDPESQLAHSELGVILAYDGQMDEALAQLKMVLDRFPYDALIHNLYAELLLSHLGDVDAYLAEIERQEREGKACNINFAPPEFVLYTRGDVAAALAKIEACVAANTDDKQAYYLDWLSMTLQLDGLDTEAREIADRALKVIQQELLDVDGSVRPDRDRGIVAWLAYFAARAEDWELYQDYRHRWSEAPVDDFFTELDTLTAVGQADALAGNPQDGWLMVEESIRGNPFVSRYTILAQLPYWSYLFGEAPAFQAFIAGTEADADE